MTREAFGRAARHATFHVYDLAVANGQHLEALMAYTVGTRPLGGADELVVADLCDLGLDVDPSLALFSI